ncbi:Alpha/beta hydrolase family-domain-containing protein, partial [Mycena vitilis]
MMMFALSLFSYLSHLLVVSGASCSCSSVIVPVQVDVLVPKDPTDAFAGLKSNASELRRVDDAFNISGTFCQPDTVSANDSNVIQLLVHGFTYTGDYWSPLVEEFQNYSYSAFSCDRGLASLAVDSLGVGLSSRPVNASDVQYPTSSAALSEVARHLKTVSIVPGLQPFRKVIGIGHSAGSALLTFGAIFEGPQSPFDGLILTGLLIIEPGSIPLPTGLTSARNDTPARWSALDPAYVTTSNRTAFYPADPTTFSPRMLVFDNFTKDVGSVSTFLQTPTSSLPAQYPGPVAKVVGSADQLFCPAERCEDVATLTAAERVVWPAAKSFDLVVSQGSGHDLNLGFAADAAFGTFVDFVDQFAAQ